MNRRWPFGSGGGGGNSSSTTGINGLGSLNNLSTVTTANVISRARSNLLGPSTGINVNGMSSPSSSPSSSSSHDVMGQISEICDGLYLCGARAIKLNRLRDLGITTIFNVTIELPNLQMEKVECIKITIEDSPYANLACYFDKVSDKIEEVRQRGGKVLVHCVAGVSRSASLCIAYMMKHNRMTLRRAYHHVKNRRSIIRPNPGFFRQLVDFEARHFGTPSVKMVWNAAAGGTIPDVYEQDYNNTLNFLNKYGSQNDHRIGTKHSSSSSSPSSSSTSLVVSSSSSSNNSSKPSCGRTSNNHHNHNISTSTWVNNRLYH